MTYQLWHGDCLEEMDRIESGSVDMICADLPYGTTACKWDVVIPFEPLWKQYKRVIKKRGAIALFGSQPFTSMLVMSNLEWFKYEWIWDKNTPTGFLNAKKSPLRQHESILIFSQGLPTYNPQMEIKTYKGVRDGINHTKSVKPDGIYGKKLKNKGDRSDYRYPKTILRFQGCSGWNSGFHPTQKPVALLSYLIRTYTNPGELVLDNCAGSGSTLEAAELEGRNSIGIEKDLNYYQIACNRLEQVVKRLNNQDLPLFAEVS